MKNENQVDSTKKIQSKKSVATIFKLIVIVGAIGASALQFSGIPVMGKIKGLLQSESANDNDLEARLSKLSAGEPKATKVSESVSERATPTPSNRSVISHQPPVKPNTVSSEQAEKVPDFVVAPDYRTAIAAAKMLENALNPEVEKKWIELRLQLNAERERTRVAEARLKRVTAEHKAAELHQQTLEIESEIRGDSKVAVESPEAASRKHAGSVKVTAIAGNTADLLVNGQYLESLSTGSYAGAYLVKSVNSENGCVSFETATGSDFSSCI
ncbi:hypothetical protein [Alteromonas antoniana]|uniref:hypothetical protein n=1 Tax=Alteromonas antoniana TaxID=2803813 RepID=UPI001C442270|nr:hypothetical protein [Alteromonas antoniana]